MVSSQRGLGDYLHLDHILETSEVQEADVALGEVVTAHGDARELPEPGKQPFDLPTPSAAAQFALVLGRAVFRPIGRDQLRAPFLNILGQCTQHALKGAIAAPFLEAAGTGLARRVAVGQAMPRSLRPQDITRRKAEREEADHGNMSPGGLTKTQWCGKATPPAGLRQRKAYSCQEIPIIKKWARNTS